MSVNLTSGEDQGGNVVLDIAETADTTKTGLPGELSTPRRSLALPDRAHWSGMCVLAAQLPPNLSFLAVAVGAIMGSDSTSVRQVVMHDFRVREHPILKPKSGPQIEFSWAGQLLTAYAGETIAAALFAHAASGH